MSAWGEDRSWLIALVVTAVLIAVFLLLATPEPIPDPTPLPASPTATATVPATATSGGAPSPTAEASSTPTATATVATPDEPATSTPRPPTSTPEPTATPELLGWHVVSPGDTLHEIGLSWYAGMWFPDSFSIWGVIWAANRDVVENPRLIYPGQRLRIPDR